MMMIASLKKMGMKVIKVEKAMRELLLPIQATLILMLHLKQVIQTKVLEELEVNLPTMEMQPMTKSTRNSALSAHFSMI
jgi:hypothetical protein